MWPYFDRRVAFIQINDTYQAILSHKCATSRLMTLWQRYFPVVIIVSRLSTGQTEVTCIINNVGWHPVGKFSDIFILTIGFCQNESSLAFGYISKGLEFHGRCHLRHERNLCDNFKFAMTNCEKSDDSIGRWLIE